MDGTDAARAASATVLDRVDGRVLLGTAWAGCAFGAVRVGLLAGTGRASTGEVVLVLGAIVTAGLMSVGRIDTVKAWQWTWAASILLELAQLLRPDLVPSSTDTTHLVGYTTFCAIGAYVAFDRRVSRLVVLGMAVATGVALAAAGGDAVVVVPGVAIVLLSAGFVDLISGARVSHRSEAVRQLEAARHAAAHAELQRELAEHDGLTGLRNRRGVAGPLAGLVPGDALALVDLDDFKAVNDTQGHAAGDDALRHAGRAVAGAVRGTDVAARWGGEEFLLLLRGDVDGMDPAHLAERVRDAVATSAAGVTASIGVAVLGPGGDWEEALRRADAALYAAKHAGRDRVHVAA